MGRLARLLWLAAICVLGPMLVVVVAPLCLRHAVADLSAPDGYPRGILWIVSAIANVMVGVAGTYSVFRTDVREDRHANGLCMECGYDLRASPGRCPECGADNRRDNRG